MTDDDIVKAISTPDPAPPHSATPPQPTSTQTVSSHATSQRLSSSLTPPHQAPPTKPRHRDTKKGASAPSGVSNNEKVKAGRKRKSSEMKSIEEEEKDIKKKLDMEEVHKSVLEEAVQMVLDVSDISEETCPSPQDEYLAAPAPEALDHMKINRAKTEEDKNMKERENVEARVENKVSVMMKKEQGCSEAQISVESRVEDTAAGGGRPESTTVGPSSSTPDAAELLEMKLRRKALESELRRRSMESEKQKELGEHNAQMRVTENLLKIQMHKERETDFPNGQQQLYEEEEEDELEEEDGSQGGVLEERLRRRALQSMWARRKSKEFS